MLTAKGAHHIPYAVYLRTSYWKRMRVKILQRDGGKCVRCGKAAVQIHHLTYARLGREDDQDLVSVCGTCHQDVHHIGIRLPTPKRIKTSKKKRKKLNAKVNRAKQVEAAVKKAMRKGWDSKDPEVQRVIDAMRWRIKRKMPEKARSVMRFMGYKFSGGEE